MFISTINAFGMSPRFNRAKHYFLPHSIYAHTKRFAERLACRLGRRHRRAVYIFRLGHVHGALQRVSQETAELVREELPPLRISLTRRPTRFLPLHRRGPDKRGARARSRRRLHLDFQPAWSWREVLEHYADPQRLPKGGTRADTSRGGLGDVFRPASGIGWVGLVHGYKDTLRANILHRFPAYERRCQAWFYAKKARREVQAYDDQLIYRPTGIHEGVIPGRRLPSLSDSRVTLKVKEEQVQAWLDGLPSRTTANAR